MIEITQILIFIPPEAIDRSEYQSLGVKEVYIWYPFGLQWGSSLVLCQREINILKEKLV